MTLKIDRYHWKCTLYLLDFNVSLLNIEESLNFLGCSNEIIEAALENIKDTNSGFCYSNIKERSTVIAIGKTDSAKQFLNSLFHEVGHLAIHIADFNNIKGEESFCYLLGTLGGIFSEALLKSCKM